MRSISLDSMFTNTAKDARVENQYEKFLRLSKQTLILKEEKLNIDNGKSSYASRSAGSKTSMLQKQEKKTYQTSSGRMSSGTRDRENIFENLSLLRTKNIGATDPNADLPDLEMKEPPTIGIRSYLQTDRGQVGQTNLMRFPPSLPNHESKCITSDNSRNTGKTDIFQPPEHPTTSKAYPKTAAIKPCTDHTTASKTYLEHSRKSNAYHTGCLKTSTKLAATDKTVLEVIPHKASTENTACNMLKGQTASDRAYTDISSLKSSSLKSSQAAYHERNDRKDYVAQSCAKELNHSSDDTQVKDSLFLINNDISYEDVSDDSLELVKPVYSKNDIIKPLTLCVSSDTSSPIVITDDSELSPKIEIEKEFVPRPGSSISSNTSLPSLIVVKDVIKPSTTVAIKKQLVPRPGSSISSNTSLPSLIVVKDDTRPSTTVAIKKEHSSQSSVSKAPSCEKPINPSEEGSRLVEDKELDSHSKVLQYLEDHEQIFSQLNLTNISMGEEATDSSGNGIIAKRKCKRQAIYSSSDTDDVDDDVFKTISNVNKQFQNALRPLKNSKSSECSTILPNLQKKRRRISSSSEDDFVPCKRIHAKPAKSSRLHLKDQSNLFDLFKKQLIVEIIPLAPSVIASLSDVDIKITPITWFHWFGPEKQVEKTKRKLTFNGRMILKMAMDDRHDDYALPGLEPNSKVKDQMTKYNVQSVFEMVQSLCTMAYAPPKDVVHSLLMEYLVESRDIRSTNTLSELLLYFAKTYTPAPGEFPFNWEDLEFVIESLQMPFATSNLALTQHYSLCTTLLVMVDYLENEFNSYPLTSQRRYQRSYAYHMLSLKSRAASCIITWIGQALGLHEFRDVGSEQQLILAPINKQAQASCDPDVDVDMPSVLTCLQRLLQLVTIGAPNPYLKCLGLLAELHQVYNQIPCIQRKHEFLFTIISPLLRQLVVQRIFEKHCDITMVTSLSLAFIFDTYFHCSMMSSSLTPPPTPDEYGDGDEMEGRNQASSSSKESVEEIAMLLWILTESYLLTKQDRLELPLSKRLTNKSSRQLPLDDRVYLSKLSDQIDKLREKLTTSQPFSENTEIYLTNLECLGCIF